jgi:hypothetical protein
MQMVTPRVSTLLAAVHTELDVTGGEREVFVAAGDALTYCAGFSAVQTAFMSSPIFDATALQQLGAIKARLQWMHRLQGMQSLEMEGANNTFQLVATSLCIPPESLFLAIQALPGPLLCSWAECWQTAKLKDTEQLSSEARRAITRSFSDIVELLHSCYQFYEVAGLVMRVEHRSVRKVDHRLWMCCHQREKARQDPALQSYISVCGRAMASVAGSAAAPQQQPQASGLQAILAWMMPSVI